VNLSRGESRLAQRLGTLTGQRVAVVAPNAPALVVGMRAAWRAGAVCVPLSARLREYELRRTLANAQPAVLISVPGYRGFSFRALAPGLMQLLPSLRRCLFVDEGGEVGEELPRDGAAVDVEPLGPDIAAVLYTSGSTGEPKGALMTHATLDAQARELPTRLALEPDEVTVLPVPVSHAFGLACLLASQAVGGTCVLADPGTSLEPLRAAVEAAGASVLHGSPALFAGLAAAPPRLRTGFVAGAPCPPGLLERLDRAGARILNMFGMTELGATTSCLLDDPPEVRQHTAGRPLPGFELRTAPGTGELQVRGPAVTPGYLGRPDLTAEAFDGDWFRTGDLGELDGAGNLHITGRIKELVQVGGFTVAPAEVEGLLLTHPDVEAAAVVGMPHARMGEALAAYVVPRAGATPRPADVVRFARERLAGYKVPYAVEIVEELPLLPSGKVDRGALRGAAA
jgi:fatty-acyl-CoA synthase